MSTRITRKDLQARVDSINELTNSPKEYSANGKTNIGHFCLSGAYGGWCLERVCNESGGVSTPLSSGHIPARELYDQLGAFIRGLQFKG